MSKIDEAIELLSKEVQSRGEAIEELSGAAGAMEANLKEALRSINPNEFDDAYGTITEYIKKTYRVEHHLERMDALSLITYSLISFLEEEEEQTEFFAEEDNE